jgi:hypothetical protein
MSAGNSRAAYMRGYRKRKRLDEDNCNNVPKLTKLNSERQRDYSKPYTQEKAQENKTPQAGNSHAAYVREYRKRMRLEKDICNNAPNRPKLHAERQREYRESHKDLSAEYMRNYRRRKTQENETSQASTSTGPTRIPIIHNYNQTNEYIFKLRFER